MNDPKYQKIDKQALYNALISNQLPDDVMIAFLENEANKVDQSKNKNNESDFSSLFKIYQELFNKIVKDKNEKFANDILSKFHDTENDNKQCIYCKECYERSNKEMPLIRKNIVLTSYPPEYVYICPECGHEFHSEILYDNAIEEGPINSIMPSSDMRIITKNEDIDIPYNTVMLNIDSNIKNNLYSVLAINSANSNITCILYTANTKEECRKVLEYIHNCYLSGMHICDLKNYK